MWRGGVGVMKEGGEVEFLLNFKITFHNNLKTRVAFNKPFDIIKMCFTHAYFVKKSHSYLICNKGVN